MTKEDAIAAANEFVANQMGPEPKLAGERCELKLISAELDKKKRWSIVYQLSLPESPGSVVDGPVVVVVDPASAKACFLDDLYNAR
ncbi:hypothetical protein WME98_18600 [Sorangium sp. So ce296]|uniref:hypothetical protein n=1 Tax=Sorangium sp. So ce296 TaxID=3133296 RepID=UPI003F63555E